MGREIIQTEKKKLLLHSCCGPCSTAVIERLYDQYDLSVYFFNPNVTDRNEYEQRLDTQKQLINILKNSGKKIDLIIGDYDPEEFFEHAKGLEKEPEGGARCKECFKFRMESSAKMAEKIGADLFTTTLTVSPHKNADVINEIGLGLSELSGVTYLESNFKKKDGYRRSVELSKEYGLYRQNYCGCKFSKWWLKEAERV